MALLTRSLFFLPLLLAHVFVVANAGILGDLIGLPIGLFPGQPGGDDGQSDEPKPEPAAPVKKPDVETDFLGSWRIASMNAGVSAMHLQIRPNGKAIMFDAASLGPSSVMLPGPHPQNCRPIPGRPQWPLDCWSHAVEYDIQKGTHRPLKVWSDSWCSSGGLAVDGTLINTGGFMDGDRSLRHMPMCDTCDFEDKQLVLASPRWYASQLKLEDGNFIVIGGRRSFSYEFVPSIVNPQVRQFNLPFLRQTTETFENNLYPFAFLCPDGNVFLFANNRAIIFNPANARVIRELPTLPGGARNYPGSGTSALLPLQLTTNPADPVQAEVLVCGGSPSKAAALSEKKQLLPALQDCGRISITDPKATWAKELMPSRRVMGDMLLLPNGEVLLINGAKAGVSGWQLAADPNLTPVLYSPGKPKGHRFTELKPTEIPRIYHSSSALLPDGKILLAGSNTNPSYNFTNLVEFPTEVRVEKFLPPYLHRSLNKFRPKILMPGSESKLIYGKKFNLMIKLRQRGVTREDIKVMMYEPPFTTHGFSQSQRMVSLGVVEANNAIVTAVAPPSGKIAPPGYHILFVVHRGVPSTGVWVTIGA